MAHHPTSGWGGGAVVTPRSELPEFTVRRSKRAKRARLTVDPQRGLVVVIPERSKMDPALYVAAHIDWVEAALGNVAEARAEHAAGPDAWLPSRLALPAIGVDAPVEYRATDSARVQARLAGGSCTVMGAIDDAPACVLALRSLLARLAREHLPILVEEVVDRIEPPLVPSEVRIAAPRRRWASCSPRGTIMLSRELLFLPRELVDHVIIHEIAHLAVPDHSARFHGLVESFDDDASSHRSALRTAREHVPAWADGVLPQR